MKPWSEMTIPLGWACRSTGANAGSASTPQALAATIGMDALCEAFRKTMLPIMQDAVSAGHEDTHLECLEKAQLCVRRFHASAALLQQLEESASTQ